MAKFRRFQERAQTLTSGPSSGTDKRQGYLFCGASFPGKLQLLARPVPPPPRAAVRAGRVWRRMKQMKKPTEMDIVRRAYELWEQAGKPDGKDQEFYHQAEQELRNEDKSSLLRTPDNL